MYTGDGLKANSRPRCFQTAFNANLHVYVPAPSWLTYTGDGLTVSSRLPNCIQLKFACLCLCLLIVCVPASSHVTYTGDGLTVSSRRRYFQTASNRHMPFSTEYVWTFHLWQEYIDYASYMLNLGYSSYDLAQHLDGQPLQVCISVVVFSPSHLFKYHPPPHPQSASLPPVASPHPPPTHSAQAPAERCLRHAPRTCSTWAVAATTWRNTWTDSPCRCVWLHPKSLTAPHQSPLLPPPQTPT
jgi:hypothetical protein